jgi:hypothetical protein
VGWLNKLFLICWFALPIFLTIVSLLSYFSSSVFVHDTKLVIKDYSLDSLLGIPFRQEILFTEIDFIYYLEEEFNLLLNYRHKLEKYEVARIEMDYRRENLVQRYGVPTHVIDAFEHSSQKILNDNTATEVLMAVEEILDRYKVQKGEKKQIIKNLKKTDNFDFEYVAQLLSPHAITQSDLDNLKDLFSNLEPDILTPFLTTKLAVAKLEKRARRHRGVPPAVRTNIVLVLSSGDGSGKIYLKHFHGLSRANWQKLIHIINEKKPGIRYLMSRLNYRNISGLYISQTQPLNHLWNGLCSLVFRRDGRRQSIWF